MEGEVHLDEINVFSLDGLKRAKKYGIMAVPTIVIGTKDKITGVPKKEDLLRIIERELKRNGMKERE